ncbi:MAG: ferrochelatase [Paracoccaceae bacterium]
MNKTDFKPADHPATLHGKTGVLLANLGTPDATDYWSVRRYLNEFLSDRRVIDLPRWKWQPLLQLVILSRRPFTSGANYRRVWNNERNEGPLLTITRDQAEKLSPVLAERLGNDVLVDFCMRYGAPSTSERVRALVDRGCERILFFPLYPQYAGASTATANDQFFRALLSLPWQPAVRTVAAYYDHPLYIRAVAQSVRDACDAQGRRPDTLVVSYHGMPERYRTEGDPYYCQCMKTARLVRQELGWGENDLVVSFQSRFGREAWLQPYTVDEVARLARAGKKHIAAISPAFSADCLETLEEIQEEIKDAFIEAGGETFTYIPCLNATDRHIEMIASIVSDNLKGWY